MGIQINYTEEDVRLEDVEVGILDLAGNIDLRTVEELNTDLNAVLRKGRKHFVLIMAGVQTIKSTGIGAILGFAKRVDAAGGTVRICELSESIAQVFDLLSIGEFLTIYPTSKEALASLKTLPKSQTGKIGRLHEKIEALQIEVDNYRDDPQSSSDPVALFSRFLADVKQKIRSLGDENRQLKETNRSLYDKIGHTEAQLRDLRAELEHRHMP